MDTLILLIYTSSLKFSFSTDKVSEYIHFYSSIKYPKVLFDRFGKSLLFNFSSFRLHVWSSSQSSPPAAGG